MGLPKLRLNHLKHKTMLQAHEGGNKTYLKIIDGKLRTEVDKETQNAVRRDWKAPDGSEGTKWELVYDTVSGTLTGLTTRDTDFGKFLNVEFDGTEVVSLHTDHRYFSDFVKKLASCDVTKPMTVRPYDFVDKNDKRVTGVAITQEGHGWKDDKAPDFFYDFEKKTYKHDFPKAAHTKENPFDKDDWKGYFLTVKKFLLAYVTLTIVPSVEKNAPKEEPLPKSFDDESEEKLSVDAVPF